MCAYYGYNYCFILLLSMSFTELVPKLLDSGQEYILSEVFSQDPLEIYFSRQRHHGGNCENPSVQDFYHNTATLVQQKAVYRDLKTMNITPSESQVQLTEPLPKRQKHNTKMNCICQFSAKVSFASYVFLVPFSPGLSNY